MSDFETQIREFEKEIEERFALKEAEPLLREVEEMIRTFIVENFEDGGRFGDEKFGGGNKRWVQSERAKLQGGQTLRDTGALQQSIQVDARVDGDNIVVEVGSNKKYARIHNLGGTIKHPGGTSYTIVNGAAKFISKAKANELKQKKKFVGVTKAHNIEMPPRPYLTLSDDDLKIIIETVTDYLLKD